jgi:hypothetical protein
VPPPFFAPAGLPISARALHNHNIVAPDGRTLATIGPEGVKLWPAVSLLPLLE